jgi:hypothetical protein
MAVTFSRARLTPAMRLFWRCMMMFLVFAQGATAAELCLDYAGGATSSALHASSSDCYPHHGQDDMLCASEVMPSDQAPSANPFSPTLDLAPALFQVSIQPPPAPPQQRHVRIDSPPAPVSQFLLFRRFLL